MTPAARDFLAKAARQLVTVGARDPAWPVITELQKAGFARLNWTAPKVANIDVTDAGRAALAEAAK